MQRKYETEEHHGGLILRRLIDGAEMFFQPGDDSQHVRELFNEIESFSIPEDRKAALWNAQAADYFDLIDA